MYASIKILFISVISVVLIQSTYFVKSGCERLDQGPTTRTRSVAKILKNVPSVWDLFTSEASQVQM